MATRDQVYSKFGITAETAQLFETELTTLLLSAKGLEHGWHIEPDPASACKAANEIDSQTLGTLLERLKRSVGIDAALKDKFTSALKARNRLVHGFYERHNFKIQTDEGRDLMVADLELLHEELFQAWQLAAAMTHLTISLIVSQQKAHAEPGSSV